MKNILSLLLCLTLILFLSNCGKEDDESMCSCTTSATGPGSEFFTPTTTTYTTQGDCVGDSSSTTQDGLTITTTCMEI